MRRPEIARERGILTLKKMLFILGGNVQFLENLFTRQRAPPFMCILTCDKKRNTFYLSLRHPQIYAECMLEICFFIVLFIF